MEVNDMFNINSDEILYVRAEERSVSAFNAGDTLLTCVIDAIALASKSKGFKIFAFIWTVINAADKGRMIYANLKARQQALDVIDDEEIAEKARENSTLSGVINGLNQNGIKYQFTGKIDI